MPFTNNYLFQWTVYGAPGETGVSVRAVVEQLEHDSGCGYVILRHQDSADNNVPDKQWKMQNAVELHVLVGEVHVFHFISTHFVSN